MSWIEKLAPFRKGGAAVAEAIRDDTGNGSTNNGPPLMCLVNDASGRASFKTHVFPDSESATDFVLYWFPRQTASGLTAFWAMTHEPVLDGYSQITVEPVVMVRDLSRDGVVYLFSFSDIESAHAFLRDEVQHGTDLGSMMLYWAVPVRMAADSSGEMRLTPSAPPGFAHDVQAEADTVAADMWAAPPTPLATESHQQEPVEDSRAIFAEAPNANTGVARPESAGDETFELTAWMERARRKPSVSRETPSPVIASSVAVPAETPLPEAEARLAHPPVEEEILWPEQHASGHQEPTGAAVPVEEVPMPVVKEATVPIVEEAPEPVVEAAPAQVVEEAAVPVVEETPVSVIEEAPVPVVKEAPVPVVEEARARASEYTSVEPARVIEDLPLAAADLSAPAPDATDDLIAEPVAFETAAPEAAPAAPVVEEATQAADQQPQRPEEAVEADADVQFDLGTVRVHANGNGHQESPEAREDGYIAINPSDIVVHQNGHSTHKPAERDAEAARRPTTQARVSTSRDNDGDGDQGVDIRIEIHLKSSRAMNIKRWEGKEEPFEGFNSPPGRF